MSLLFALLAASLTTQTGNPTVAPATSGAKERKICKGIVNTGSRLANKRVCRTAAEWDEETRRAAEQAGRAVEAANRGGGGR